MRLHDLRYTFGTRMAAAGVPMRTLQEWLGHRDFATTLSRRPTTPQSARSRMDSDGAGRFRTGDLLVANQMLSQLSYGPSRPSG